MQPTARQKSVLIVLLSVFFLTAQFHFCADLTSTASVSHVCPICSATGSVITLQSPSIALVPVAQWLEVAPLVVSVSSAVPRATSPRAPPAC